MMEEVQETFDTLGKVIDGNLYLNRKIYEDTVAYEDGVADGQADGYEKGQADGHISGLAEGRACEKKEIAKNFLSIGTSIEDISKATGLTIEEINKLKD